MAKRKASSKFDFDVLRASVNAKVEQTRQVRELLQGLHGVNVQDIVRKEYDLTEDEILQVLEVKLSIEGLYNLRKAIQHVPANVTCVVEGTAMRHKFIFITLVCLSPELDITLEEISVYCNAFENCCPKFMSKKEKIADEDLGKIEKYLTPPVSTCTECNKALSMQNNPSTAVCLHSMVQFPVQRYLWIVEIALYTLGAASSQTSMDLCFIPQQNSMLTLLKSAT